MLYEVEHIGENKMKNILYNISNHPSTGWSDSQRAGWERIIDLPFPEINPLQAEQEIAQLARDFFVSMVRDIYADYRKTVRSGSEMAHPDRSRKTIRKMVSLATFHVAGEWSFFYALVTLLKRYNATVVCACSERRTVETVDPVSGSTIKKTEFQFRQWRQL
jgi:hypothetical protein